MGGVRGCRVVQRDSANPKRLILAVANYAEGLREDDDTPCKPPPELVLAWRIEQFGSEAVLGRVLYADELSKMTTCVNVYSAVSSFRVNSINAAEWARRNPSQLKIVSKIRELRNME